MGYTLEYTPPRDKHAGGIAERSIGLVVLKANEAMMGSTITCPMNMWPHAIQYAIDSANFNPNSVVADSAYHYETGLHIDMRHLHPFFCPGYMFIPLIKRAGKLGCPRAQLVHFLGYVYTTSMQPNFLVVPVISKGRYGKPIVSKDVVFDNNIPYLTTDHGLYPTDAEFDAIPALSPIALQQLGPYPLALVDDVPQYWIDDSPLPAVYPTPSGLGRSSLNIVPMPRKENPPVPDTIFKLFAVTNRYADGPKCYLSDLTCPHPSYLQTVSNNAHYKAIHYFFKAKTIPDPSIPKTFPAAIILPEWKEAIDIERDNFEKFSSLEIVERPQHEKLFFIPLMWLFNIKTDGRKKARLVGCGHLMKPGRDFDPDQVYCGNISAVGIKIVLRLAAI